ncbi:hypothetical protein CEP51_016294 [Fusarium floridanum]|uniref:Uncharacterized protein n=1 Tax=Fusarium floridanum TaxID=1325733 RepID=A0A428NT27_9HYPO|nr:hypothetical protein CEP51_016294 [Fusarium floridanum]
MPSKLHQLSLNFSRKFRARCLSLKPPLPTLNLQLEFCHRPSFKCPPTSVSRRDSVTPEEGCFGLKHRLRSRLCLHGSAMDMFYERMVYHSTNKS